MDSRVVSIIWVGVENKLENVELLLLEPNPMKHSQKLFFRMPIVRIPKHKMGSEIKSTVLGSVQKLLELTDTSKLVWLDELKITDLSGEKGSPETYMAVIQYTAKVITREMSGAGLPSKFIYLKESGSSVRVGEQSSRCIGILKKWLIDTKLQKLVYSTNKQNPTTEPIVQYKGGSGPIPQIKNSINQKSSSQQPILFQKSSKQRSVSHPENVSKDVPSTSITAASTTEFQSDEGLNQNIVQQKNVKVIKNPFLSPAGFYWKTELTVINPFWKYKSPDYSKLGMAPSRCLYKPSRWVERDKHWEEEYPIHKAACRGNTMDLEELLKPSLSLRVLNRSCSEELSTRESQYETLDSNYELSSTISIRQFDWLGWSAIHYAAAHGQLNTLMMLMTQTGSYISVNYKTNNNSSPLNPLQLAIIYNQEQVALWLIKNYLDIDLKEGSDKGLDVKTLAIKKDMESVILELKNRSSNKSFKTLPIQVVGDNSIREVVLTKGPDTCLSELHSQMLDILEIPHTCENVFSFWLGVRKLRINNRFNLIPLQIVNFGSYTWHESLAIKSNLRDGNLKIKHLISSEESLTLFWARNLLLSLDFERRIKSNIVINLLFGEAMNNFTIRSRYQCDQHDAVLMSSILLFLNICKMSSDKSLLKSQLNQTPNRRASSLPRTSNMENQTPSSNYKVEKRHQSNHSEDIYNHSQLLKSTSLSSSRFVTSTYNLDSDIIQKQAREFLNNEKNLLSILPKKLILVRDTNLGDKIYEKFIQSSFVSHSNSILECKYRFLCLCWNLILYGCAYFDVEVKFKPGTPHLSCILAINDMGAYLLKKHTKKVLQTFRYSCTIWEPLNGTGSTNERMGSPNTNQTFQLTKRQTNYLFKSKDACLILKIMTTLHNLNLPKLIEL